MNFSRQITFSADVFASHQNLDKKGHFKTSVLRKKIIVRFALLQTVYKSVLR